ncbi:MAG: hypothetical protein LCI03_06525 [Actinobacteria bacterium]|nr:hypothetical protein [Actinomycetota bacterium]
MTGDRDWPAENELDERLAVLEVAASHFYGVREIEHLLVGLLDLMRSDRLPKDRSLAALEARMVAWPPGTVELLEFTMRELRWPEVQSSLKMSAANHPDFRARDQARQALEVYAEDWPNGEIYRTYAE